jgi:hypothetical protein
MRIEAAGARDAGAHRPAGFPWLRTTRFSASYRDELSSETQWAAWLARLQAEDLTARRAELRNAGAENVAREFQRLASCGQQLNAALIKDATARKRLRVAAAVPDDYSIVQRLFGAYPLALPFLRQGIRAYQNEIRAAYAEGIPATTDKLGSRATMQLWRGPLTTAAHLDVETLTRDALGVPQLTAQQWQQLAQQHAPAWWIETAADYDKPGAILLSSRHAQIDSRQAVVYFDTSFTRFYGEVLPQLLYVMWFSERPSTSVLDPYAGRLDGLVWRVTLDAKGRPLFYDSIHSCGCYHMVYPAQSLSRKTAVTGDDEPFVFPQTSIPDMPIALRIATATHYLSRVLPLAQARAAGQQSYRLRRYDELRSLPLPDSAASSGQIYRSLFGVHGLISGSERAERWWLWPSGVASPGAMRQHGRQALAFTGMRHFDDADLAEQMFD